jgi:putative hydrolase of the HAD superfamily
MADYLIWDFDDTLGHRHGGKWTASLLAVLQTEMPDFPVEADAIRPHMQSGFPWHTPEVAHTHITSADAWWESLHPLFAKAFRSVGLPANDAMRLARHVRDVYTEPSAWRLFDDTLPTLRRLAESGWTHCLLTNHVPELPSILSHLGLLDAFAVVVNSADAGYEKPHPEAFRRVLQTLRDPRHVWMIGDSYEADILGAEVVGIPGVLARKSDPRARICCHDLRAVADVLRDPESCRRST